MDIYNNIPGTMVAIPAVGVPMVIFMEGWVGPAYKCIVTGFQLQTQSGVQFMHTLRDFIYVYVFGDRIAPLTISGVAFRINACPLLNPGLPNIHGYEYALNYYNLNRVGTRGRPLTIVLGLSVVLSGFLTESSIGVQDTEHNIANFSFGFQTIPQSTFLDVAK